MQNQRNSDLPSWLSWLVILCFAAHFALVGAYQFGRGVLPDRLNGWIEQYNLPWFYQNYLMFAPDPVDHMNTFLYRLEEDGEWTAWKDPAFPYLQSHWSFRFGHGSDMFRIISGIADALFNGAQYVQFKEHPDDEDWYSMPGYGLAERYVLQSEHGFEGFQVGVLTEHHRIDDEGRLHKVTIFQAYPPKTVKDE